MIGVLDSGVGGLTVARCLLQQVPGLGLLYYGDTAHVPYGNRSAEEVRGLVEAIVAHLVESGVEAVVMACNTSSALVLDTARRRCPVPLVGVIEAGARAAARATRNGRIGILANPLTAASGAYERALRWSARGASFELVCVGCPRLVPLVEAGRVGGPEVREALEEYLEPLREVGVDTLLHGCTHYPFLREAIARILGPEVHQVDPAEHVLEELLRQGWSPPPPRRVPAVRQFQVSGPPREFERVATRLTGRRFSGVRQVTLAPRRQAASWGGTPQTVVGGPVDGRQGSVAAAGQARCSSTSESPPPLQRAGCAFDACS